MGQGVNCEIGFNDDYSQYPSDMACVDEFTYLAINQSYANSFFLQQSIYKIDTIGNILWSAIVSPVGGEVTYLDQMIPSEDGGVYMIGTVYAACDVLQGCNEYIQKYSPSGAMVWTKLFPDTMCANFKLSGITINSSDQLYVNYVDSNGSHIYTIENGGGTTVDTLLVAVQNLEGFADVANYQVVGYKQDNLFGFDNSGNTITTHSFSTPIQDIISVNDTLYVLTQDSLILLDSNMQTLLGADVTGYVLYSNLKLNNGGIQFISGDTTVQHILTLNDLLQLIDVKTISVELLTDSYKDFSLTHFSCGIKFPITEYTVIRYLDFSLKSAQNSFVNTGDIGIAEIQVNDNYALLDPFLTGIYTTDIEISVLLKNYGQDTVNNCVINHRISMGICNDAYYMQSFSNLNLAPNDSVWVYLGWIDYTTNFYSDTIQRNVCVYTSYPNNLTDTNVSNDHYCKNIIIGLVGLDEMEQNPISIFPNPTTGLLQIDFGQNVQNVRIRLLSIEGKLLKSISQRYTSGNYTQQMDLSGYAKGIYYVQIVTEGNVITRKVVYH